jgi:hypothetical protein
MACYLELYIYLCRGLLTLKKLVNAEVGPATLLGVLVLPLLVLLASALLSLLFLLLLIIVERKERGQIYKDSISQERQSGFDVGALFSWLLLESGSPVPARLVLRRTDFQFL